MVNVTAFKDCMRYLECVASKKRDYRIYLATPAASTKVLPIHQVSISLFIVAINFDTTIFGPENVSK